MANHMGNPIYEVTNQVGIAKFWKKQRNTVMDKRHVTNLAKTFGLAERKEVVEKAPGCTDVHEIAAARKVKRRCLHNVRPQPVYDCAMGLTVAIVGADKIDDVQHLLMLDLEKL